MFPIFDVAVFYIFHFLKLRMYKKASCRRKNDCSRCVKTFRKRKSHEEKESGNCCWQFMKNLGFAEISKCKSSLRRAMKLFVFSICTAGFFYHTWTFLQLYLTYPTMLDISEEYPENISVPAITICNKNRLLRQSYCKTYPEECKEQNSTWEEFCDKYRRQCPHFKPPDFNFGIPDPTSHTVRNLTTPFLDAIGPQKESDLIMVCVLSGKTYNRPCNSSIIIQAAKYGFPYKCFSLLSLLGKQNEEPLKLTFTDEYTVVLDMHPEEYINNDDSVQASVILHDPRKIVNPMTEGITLSSGKIYKLYPTMEKRESLPPPYAPKCTDYLKEWKENGGYGPLSKKDCTDMCKIKAMVEEYGCVGRTTRYPNNYTVCFERRNVASPEVNKRCSSICRDACEENIYHFTTEIFSEYSSQCDPKDEYCKNRLLYIVVSFSRMTVQRFQQIPRFESIELFSYIGGYLGMWLGISLSSMFDFAEMIYHVVAYPFLKRRRNQKKTTPIKQFRHHTLQK